MAPKSYILCLLALLTSAMAAQLPAPTTPPTRRDDDILGTKFVNEIIGAESIAVPTGAIRPSKHHSVKVPSSILIATATDLDALGAVPTIAIAESTPTPIARQKQGPNGTSRHDNLYSELPIDTALTPAYGIAGALLILSGLCYVVFAIKFQRLYTAFSAAYLTSLTAVVVALVAIRGSVTDGGQIGILAVVTVLATAAGFLTRYCPSICSRLGAAFGGFCFAMWILTLKSGGSIVAQGGIIALIFVFAIVPLLTTFYQPLRSPVLLNCTSFGAATVMLLGIDFFTCMGLKEFWVYIWHIRHDLFSATVPEYPVTSGIRCETIMIMVLAILCLVVQILWSARERRMQELEVSDKRYSTDETVHRDYDEASIRDLRRVKLSRARFEDKEMEVTCDPVRLTDSNTSTAISLCDESQFNDIQPNNLGGVYAATLPLQAMYRETEEPMRAPSRAPTYRTYEEAPQFCNPRSPHHGPGPRDLQDLRDLTRNNASASSASRSLNPRQASEQQSRSSYARTMQWAKDNPRDDPADLRQKQSGPQVRRAPSPSAVSALSFDTSNDHDWDDTVSAISDEEITDRRAVEKAVYKPRLSLVISETSGFEFDFADRGRVSMSEVATLDEEPRSDVAHAVPMFARASYQNIQTININRSSSTRGASRHSTNNVRLPACAEHVLTTDSISVEEMAQLPPLSRQARLDAWTKRLEEAVSPTSPPISTTLELPRQRSKSVVESAAHMPAGNTSGSQKRSSSAHQNAATATASLQKPHRREKSASRKASTSSKIASALTVTQRPLSSRSSIEPYKEKKLPAIPTQPLPKRPLVPKQVVVKKVTTTTVSSVVTTSTTVDAPPTPTPVDTPIYNHFRTSVLPADITAGESLSAQYGCDGSDISPEETPFTKRQSRTRAHSQPLTAFPFPETSPTTTSTSSPSDPPHALSPSTKKTLRKHKSQNTLNLYNTASTFRHAQYPIYAQKPSVALEPVPNVATREEPEGGMSFPAPSRQKLRPVLAREDRGSKGSVEEEVPEGMLRWAAGREGRMNSSSPNLLADMARSEARRAGSSDVPRGDF